MQDKGSMGDDSVLMRWMRTEVNKMNEGIVSERKNLAQLLLEDNPSAKTKAGKDHVFYKATLHEIGGRIPKNLYERLKLPLLFFFDNQVPDSCYLNDTYALQTLQALGDVSSLRTMRQGKLWVGKSIAYSIMKKYPTAVQIVMG